MHIPVSPDAPAILRFAADSILTLHIGGGAVGMVAGFAAMALKKGGRLHRLAGNVFTVAMLTMAGIGAAASPFVPHAHVYTDVLAGTFTCYLVLTARLTALRSEGAMGRLEVIGFAFALCGMAAAFTGIWLNDHAAHPARGASGMGLYVFALIASIAAASDLHLILRGGLAGPSRLARHIWRVSVGLTIATGSFFLGQPDFLPTAIRDTFIPTVPVLGGLVLMVFWLIRVRLPHAVKLVPAIA